MLKKIIEFISRREMLKHMAVLAGGTAIGQALSFAASPILSRLFNENDYGEFGVFASAVTYCVVIASLRLENAIVLPKSNTEGKSIAQWAIKINTIVSLSTFMVTLIGVFVFNFSYYFLLLGPTVFFRSIIQTLNFYSSRQKSYSHNSYGRIINSLSIAAVSILLGYYNFGTTGLIFGMFFGNIIAALYLLYFIHPEIYSVTNHLSWRDLNRQYKSFIRINTPHALFDLTESSGLILIMGLFFSSAEIGAYFFAFRILRTPVALIGNSIYQVFFRDVSEKVSNGKSVLNYLQKMIFRLSAISLPIFIVLYFFGEWLFTFVFGEDWRLSGIYSAILAPWFWLNFVASTLSCMPLVLNKQNEAFAINIVFTVIKICLTLIAGYFYDFYVLIMLFTLSQSSMMLFNLIWYNHITKKHSISLPH